MNLPASFSVQHVDRYRRIIQEWLEVSCHYDLLLWLQGEIQHYLPHEIMLAAWGNFDTDTVCHDIVSALLEVRSENSDVRTLLPLLQGLFHRWIQLGKVPYALGSGEYGFLMEERVLQCPLGGALQGMHSMLIHGINDKRGQHDCLYVMFSSSRNFSSSLIETIRVVLPYIHAAFGRMDPPIRHARQAVVPLNPEEYGFSPREIEIMEWTRMGKTVSETAAILDISAFTVKNCLLNLFKKLHAAGRSQAMSAARKISSNDE
jgi:transcriptional regulator EpsA